MPQTTQTLYAIGGGINWKSPRILDGFIERAGGTKARIVILPQASSEDDTGEFYRDHFRKLGVKNPLALEFRLRADADRPAYLSVLRKATGIFIGGGAQMRVTALAGGTQLECELLAAFQRGVIVGGTSAGAAVLSKVMIAYGRRGSTPRERSATLSPGLGFSDRIIFDQHFRERNRIGRLLYAVAMHPGLLGIGIDEDTAAIVEDDAFVTVAGPGGVTIVDGREMKDTNVGDVIGSRPIAVSGLKVHVLTAGCSFDIESGLANIPKVYLPDD
jgi:cyanophycinase